MPTSEVRATALSPIAAVSKHKRLAAAVVLVGLLLGCGYAFSGAVTTTAEARIGVDDSGAPSVGIGDSGSTSQLADNYARYVNDLALARGEQGSLSASVVADSNVIRVTATARSSRQAVRAAASAASDVVQRVNEDARNTRRQLLKAYNRAATTWSTADAANTNASARLRRLVADTESTDAEVAEAQSAAASAASTLASASLVKDSTAQNYQNQIADTAVRLEVVGKTGIVGSDKSRTLIRYGSLGVFLGLAAALVIATLLERRGAQDAPEPVPRARRPRRPRVAQ